MISDWKIEYRPQYERPYHLKHEAGDIWLTGPVGDDRLAARQCEAGHVVFHAERRNVAGPDIDLLRSAFPDFEIILIGHYVAFPSATFAMIKLAAS